MPALFVVLLALVALARPAAAAGDRPPEEVWPRVQYHVRHAVELGEHFESLMRSDCRRFSAREDWDSYVDAEVDRVVLLLAHVEQAWEEAKTTGDDDVRRAAKAPRRRMNEARAFIDKMSACAEVNGTSLPMFSLWQRIEREVPRRQAEIALPR